MPGRRFIIFILLYCYNEASSIEQLKSPTNDVSDSIDNGPMPIILQTKNILRSKNDVSKTMNSIDNNASYINFSDDVLLQIINQQPKQKKYNFNDVHNIIIESNARQNKLNIKFNPYNFEPDGAVFRLDDKEVKPFNFNDAADIKFTALQKLNNILYSRPQNPISEDKDRQKEMTFNLLLDQLKSLCCKKHKRDYPNNINYQYLKDEFIKSTLSQQAQLIEERSKEQLFLILNDEIQSNNVAEELILVDPDTLSKNSSVVLLGPITTPLSDVQLKFVMSRIGNELSKPEYLPLLQRISKGVVDETIEIMNSIVTGPNTRRYIKPHRCNHQSKLSKIYVGPKWLICTGYLNFNSPSLYD